MIDILYLITSVINSYCMKEDYLKKVGLGSGTIMAGFVLGAFFQYLIQIVLARSFGPDTYGVFVQALAVTQAAATVSMLGIHRAVPKFVPEYREKENYREINEVLSTSLLITLSTTTVLSVIIYNFSGSISRIFFSDPAITAPLTIFSVTVIPLGLIYLFISFFRGFENARLKVFLDDIVFSGLVLLFALIIVFYQKGIEKVIYGYLVAEIITAVTAYILLKRNFRLKPAINSLKRDSASKLLSFSWPLFMISVFLMANKWAGVWTLGFFRESAEVGIYNASYSLAGSLFLVLSSLNYMFLPTASSLYGKGDVDSVRDLFSNVTRWTAVVSPPLFIGMLIFPSAILQLFFSSSYAQEPVILSIMASGFFYTVITGPSGSLLVAAGLNRQKLVGIASISITLILLSILLIPGMGIIGAALATSGGFIIGHSLLLGLAIRKTGSTPYNRDFIYLILSTAVPLAIVYILKSIYSPEVMESVFLGALFVLIYGFMINRFKVIKPDEKTVVFKTLKSIMDRKRN